MENTASTSRLEELASKIVDGYQAAVDTDGGDRGAKDIDPAVEAGKLLQLMFRVDGQPALRWHRGTFWLWNGLRYTILPDADVRAMAAAWLDDRGFTKVAARNVNDLFAAIQNQCIVVSATRMPSWIGENGPRRPIAFRNGIVDLDAALAGRADALRPHSPQWFSGSCLPYDYNPDADCRLWPHLISEAMDGDAERVALIQEWFGYCLLHGTQHQKFAILAGEGATGKSTALAVLTALLGTDNVSAVPLERLGSRFDGFQLLGKLANISAEIGDLDRAAEGHLKALVSGDPVVFEQKHRDPITARPMAKLVFAANSLPKFSDTSSGLWRRMILIPFDRIIPEDKRRPGLDTPDYWRRMRQLPGIFNWAVEGLRRLEANGRFTESSVATQALAEYRTSCDPIGQFLSEHYRVSPEGLVLKSGLYEHYRQWCQATGNRPASSAEFGREVARKFPSAKTIQPRVDGKQLRAWAGICPSDGQ